MPYFEGLRTWSGRSALHTLEHSAWYTRLALGSNICLRVGPLTLIVAGDSGIQAVRLLTMLDSSTLPCHWRRGRYRQRHRPDLCQRRGQIDHCWYARGWRTANWTPSQGEWGWSDFRQNRAPLVS